LLQIIKQLQKTDIKILNTLKVNKWDRVYQVWKREALSIELRASAVFNQKLEYIHYNPVKAELCFHADEYYYSSTKFYYNQVDEFNMLTHYLDS
jgi:putative transposase